MGIPSIPAFDGVSSHANFTIVRPTPTIVFSHPVPGDALNVLNLFEPVPGPYLQLGNPSFQYTFSVSGVADGRLFVTQFIQQNLTHDGVSIQRTNGAFKIDNCAVYDGGATVGSAATYASSDTPNLLLSAGQWEDQVGLRTFFMFMPAGGVPVALQESTLTYNAHVSFTNILQLSINTLLSDGMQFDFVPDALGGQTALPTNISGVYLNGAGTNPGC